MVDARFDNRSQSTFAKDIKFGTAIESYFFQEWLKRSHPAVIHEWNHNGVDNDGEYIESGNRTAGADYWVKMDYLALKKFEMPLEMKWVPTAGKLTLKVGDLKGYIREGAGILFIYNSNPNNRDLRKPKDRDLDRHIRRIERASKDIRWGIMLPVAVKTFLDVNQDRIENIKYMGFKPGIILPASEYYLYFQEEQWDV